MCLLIILLPRPKGARGESFLLSIVVMLPGDYKILEERLFGPLARDGKVLQGFGDKIV